MENVATITTELPHDLKVGTEIELVNIKSTQNTTGAQKLGFNKLITVAGISSSRTFTAGLTTDPGTFKMTPHLEQLHYHILRERSILTTTMCLEYQEAQKYIFGEQDGIYYLTVLKCI